MIEIRNLTKRYGTFEALSGFNLTIKDNSIFGLVGINGAGKSTLLRLLSGVYKPDYGDILIDDRPVFEDECRKREIFFLPDEPFYSSVMNGKSIAELYRVFYDFDDKVFEKYIEIYKLDLTVPVRNFSKGMKRRLFVSIAFAASPKYLFLDEVFDGLDPAARQVFKRGLIETVERTNGTAVIASHSLLELEDICDSYGIIDGKRLIDSGSVSESTENIFKFQLAFDHMVYREDLGFDCMSFEASGRIVRVIVRGDKEEYLAKIARLDPLLVDELPVDFEEFFISEIAAREELK